MKIFGYKKVLTQQNFASKKNFQKIRSKKFGKIGSVTADMMLIWTNVTRTNFAFN